jgi:hypothetical protein
MAVQRIAHPSVTDRSAEGRQARDRTPLSSHQRWAPAAERPDPVALLEERDATREPDLVPVRHGRMLVSPFTFYRGAAKLMAADLNDTPTAGLDTQLCGDAHLSNFGAFGRLPRRGRPVRPVDHRVLRALRRPERAGLPGVRGRDPFRPPASPRRHVRPQTGGASRIPHRWSAATADRPPRLASGLARLPRSSLSDAANTRHHPRGVKSSPPARRGVAIHPIRVMPSLWWTDSMRTEGGRGTAPRFLGGAVCRCTTSTTSPTGGGAT